MSIDNHPHPTLRFFVSQALTSQRKITISRSWKSRLFSWPWQPWVAEEEVWQTIPDPCLYPLGEMAWIGHPETVDYVAEQFRRDHFPVEQAGELPGGWGGKRYVSPEVKTTPRGS